MEVILHHWHDKPPSADFWKRDVERETEGFNASQRPTIPQTTLLILWLVAILSLVARLGWRRRQATTVIVTDYESASTEEKDSLLLEEEEEEEKASATASIEKALEANSSLHERSREHGSGDGCHGDEGGRIANGDVEQGREADGSKENASASQTTASTTKPLKSGEAATFTPVKLPPTLDRFLLYAVGLGAVLFYFYVCDVRQDWPAGERVYSRDTFLFLTLLMFLVAAAFTVRSCPDKILNRDQTEEWKGWMQVMFVWYHYFKAAETYNLVRVYIACYVWMTGFGNFSFFWVKRDFSLWRMIKMLFRLNFLVILVALVTNNSYMLYYICAMHTYWFFSVYFFMSMLPSWNDVPRRMMLKFAAYFICNAVIFDTPFVRFAFKPLWWLLSYEGSMHEWEFRAGLDHYACLVGMLCAYNYPHYERWSAHLDKRHLDRRDSLLAYTIKTFIVAILVLLTVWWYKHFMLREKYSYNQIHPYISWFPILSYVVLRNLFPALRTRYLHFFSFLGKITLETYISQLHIFMQSNAKELIVYLPGYPLINFTMATVIYLFVSYWLFEITTVFSAFLLPQSLRRVGIHFGLGCIICGLAACIALLIREGGVV